MPVFLKCNFYKESRKSISHPTSKMSYNTINTTCLELLSKNNYDTWRIQAEALLIKNDTWAYVSGEKPKPSISADTPSSQAAYNAWIAQDRKAKSDLILSISPSELKQIKTCETSKDVWNKLESIYASKGPARKATLLKSLMLNKMPEGGDVMDHLNGLFDAIDKLQSMNIEINGDMLAIIILYSLPDSYDTFRCAMESRDDLPDAETLKVKIIEESEARAQKTSDTESGASFAKHHNRQPQSSKAKSTKDNKTAPKRIRCNYCRKLGHKAINCYARKNAELGTEQKVSHATETALISDNKHEIGGWCLDSGCTSHLCGDKELLIDTKNISSGLKLANGATTKVEAIGDIKITASVNRENKDIRLVDALYVPDLRTNLLSVARIVDRGYEVTFKKNRAVVRDPQGKVRMVANRTNNLFYLQESPPQAYMAAKREQTQAKVWHDRLAHLNMKDISRMHKAQAVNGLKLDAKVLPSCEVCAAGKLCSTPFPTGSRKTHEPLELIHTDVCGPMRTESLGGARYFVTFIDGLLTMVPDIYYTK